MAFFSRRFNAVRPVFIVRSVRKALQVPFSQEPLLPFFLIFLVPSLDAFTPLEVRQVCNQRSPPSFFFFESSPSMSLLPPCSSFGNLCSIVFLRPFYLNQLLHSERFFPFFPSIPLFSPQQVTENLLFLKNRPLADYRSRFSLFIPPELPVFLSMFSSSPGPCLCYQFAFPPGHIRTLFLFGLASPGANYTLTFSPFLSRIENYETGLFRITWRWKFPLFPPGPLRVAHPLASPLH